jgi:cellulose synthase/poly-beta-1,6-N-acetylglucosamine synthase-like glycosyltransferase
MTPASYEVVVPTVGRRSVRDLLRSLEASAGPLPERVWLVFDRPAGDVEEVRALVPDSLAPRVRVVRGEGRGPAAARNLGWRLCSSEWVAFLDDDVVPAQDWPARLAGDLDACRAPTAATQGRVRVPLPEDRPPTDWERNVAGLETARWATADMAYRRAVLEEVGGFDERFPRAYREDADLALRVTSAGYEIQPGDREVVHPAGRADVWTSVRLQAGNADDPLMHALHGRGWRARAGAPRGRRARHALVSLCALLGLGGAAARRGWVVAVGALGWVTGVAELTWARVAPGPRTPREVSTMVVTSAVIPSAAVWHWLRGWLRVARMRARGRLA